MTRRAFLVLAALFSFAFVVIIGCGGGGGSNPTNPGGGGPTFNLTFPATGASQSLVFNDAGSWVYHCTPHGTATSGMRGTVVVDAGSANDSALVTGGPSNTLTCDPTSVTIKPGGRVRWFNESSMTNHTVTRP